ncbi:uncharacterized protein LOC113205942 [Frankliniella occidentalis]|uniref:Uncharacterized protein LOC113205942 n=1 Tax=Frankliniella occidentalis TaxID=133901 RepID=A0A9C6U4N7_FRAOC|nr:uncharacterized protein LOC113205942 [Frankliniella occidentalis]
MCLQSHAESSVDPQEQRRSLLVEQQQQPKLGQQQYNQSQLPDGNVLQWNHRNMQMAHSRNLLPQQEPLLLQSTVQNSRPHFQSEQGQQQQQELEQQQNVQNHPPECEEFSEVQGAPPVVKETTALAPLAVPQPSSTTQASTQASTPEAIPPLVSISTTDIDELLQSRTWITDLPGDANSISSMLDDDILKGHDLKAKEASVPERTSSSGNPRNEQEPLEDELFPSSITIEEAGFESASTSPEANASQDTVVSEDEESGLDDELDRILISAEEFEIPPTPTPSHSETCLKTKIGDQDDDVDDGITDVLETLDQLSDIESEEEASQVDSSAQEISARPCNSSYSEQQSDSDFNKSDDEDDEDVDDDVDDGIASFLKDVDEFSEDDESLSDADASVKPGTTIPGSASNKPKGGIQAESVVTPELIQSSGPPELGLPHQSEIAPVETSKLEAPNISKCKTTSSSAVPKAASAGLVTQAEVVPHGLLTVPEVENSKSDLHAQAEPALPVLLNEVKETSSNPESNPELACALSTEAEVASPVLVQLTETSSDHEAHFEAVPSGLFSKAKIASHVLNELKETTSDIEAQPEEAPSGLSADAKTASPALNQLEETSSDSEAPPEAAPSELSTEAEAAPSVVPIQLAETSSGLSSEAKTSSPLLNQLEETSSDPESHPEPSSSGLSADAKTASPVLNQLEETTANSEAPPEAASSGLSTEAEASSPVLNQLEETSSDPESCPEPTSSGLSTDTKTASPDLNQLEETTALSEAAPEAAPSVLSSEAKASSPVLNQLDETSYDRESHPEPTSSVLSTETKAASLVPPNQLEETSSTSESPNEVAAGLTTEAETAAPVLPNQLVETSLTPESPPKVAPSLSTAAKATSPILPNHLKETSSYAEPPPEVVPSGLSHEVEATPTRLPAKPNSTPSRLLADLEKSSSGLPAELVPSASTTAPNVAPDLRTEPLECQYKLTTSDSHFELEANISCSLTDAERASPKFKAGSFDTMKQHNSNLSARPTQAMLCLEPIADLSASQPKATLSGSMFEAPQCDTSKEVDLNSSSMSLSELESDLLIPQIAPETAPVCSSTEPEPLEHNESNDNTLSASCHLSEMSPSGSSSIGDPPESESGDSSESDFLLVLSSDSEGSPDRSEENHNDVNMININDISKDGYSKDSYPYDPYELQPATPDIRPLLDKLVNSASDDEDYEVSPEMMDIMALTEINNESQPRVVAPEIDTATLVNIVARQHYDDADLPDELMAALEESDVDNIVIDVDPKTKCQQCGKNAKFTCIACLKVCYCSTECAEKFWDEEHAETCDRSKLPNKAS